MKIIDLLVKISQGEIMPKKIKYEGYVWEYDKATKDYYRNDIDEEYIYLFQDLFEKETGFFINNEAEIIEEDKKIKMLEPVRGSDLTDLTSKDVVLKNSALIELCKTLNNINNKVNELIDEINNLKGEK